MEGENILSKRVLVTGGAGFIGSHIADQLVRQKIDVTVIDDLSYGKRGNVNKKVLFIRQDILEYEKLKEIMKERFDYIFHLAASATTKESCMGWKDPLYDYQINAIGTLNVLKAITQSDHNPKVIYASSAAVYGNPECVPIDEKHPTKPISPYGISKLAGEKYCFAFLREYGIKSVSLRMFNVYGPRQPRYVMLDLFKKLYKKPDRLRVLGTGKEIRDFCYVTDVVRTFISIAEKDVVGEFNVAGGSPISIKELAEKIVDISGLKEKTKIYYTGQSWKGDIKMLIANISKIKKTIDFKPEVNLEEGLIKLKRFLMNQ